MNPRSQSTLLARLQPFARQLHPVETRKRLRFLARSMFYATVTRDLLDYLEANPPIARIVALQPWLFERLHRPYLRAHLNARQRLAVILAHYEYCNRLGWQALCLKIAQAPIELARIPNRHTHTYRLQLTYASRFSKEGEWAVHLLDGQRRIYTFCASLLQERGQRLLFIGCLQGPTGADGRDLVRRVTRDLYGYRPRDLMLEAARAIGEAAGVAYLGLIATRDHVYRHPRSRWRKRNTMTAWTFDYDVYAAELGGTADTAGYWRIPLRKDHKPIEAQGVALSARPQGWRILA